jgi:acyl-CoA thioesterase-1
VSPSRQPLVFYAGVVTVNRSDFQRSRLARVPGSADVLVDVPGLANGGPFVVSCRDLVDGGRGGPAGAVLPPASAAIYWETMSAWWGADFSSGVRFDVAASKVVKWARLPCTVASGNIEVAVHRVVPMADGGFLGVKVGSSGVVACPAPVVNAITVPFTADVVLSPGQYVASLWCDNETAEFLHALSTGLLRSGVALSFDVELADGLPQIGELAYSGRAVAIVLEESSEPVGSVVLLGDSITQQQVWFTAGAGLAGELWAETNEGNPGESSAAIAARVAADVVAVRPQLCMVLAGTNDVGETSPVAADTIRNLAAILAACRAANIPVILGTIPPRFNTAGLDALSTVQRAALVEVNAWIRAQVDAPMVRVADWTVELSTGDGITPNTAYFTDHVHPNQAGGYVMAQVLAGVLG